MRTEQGRHDSSHVRARVVGDDRGRVGGQRRGLQAGKQYRGSQRRGLEAGALLADLLAVISAVAPQRFYHGRMRVSTRGDYAARALLSLALQGDEAGPTSVRDIAERTGLPQPYLEQILLALKGAGLVRSKRGVGGGYILARSPSDILLSEIVAAVDGPITVGDFGEPHEDGACDHEGQCVLLAIWKESGAVMRAHLDGYTLAGIAEVSRGNAAWPSGSHA